MAEVRRDAEAIEAAVEANKYQGSHDERDIWEQTCDAIDAYLAASPSLVELSEYERSRLSVAHHKDCARGGLIPTSDPCNCGADGLAARLAGSSRV